MPTTPLPIDLVEPDAPAPVGDRLPCHLFLPEVRWPMPPDEVLRADKPVPPRNCPPCSGVCRQGRDCPVVLAARAAQAACDRHNRIARRIAVAFWVGLIGMTLFLHVLP